MALCLMLLTAGGLGYVLANNRIVLRTLNYYWEDIGVHENRNLLLGSSSIERLNAERYLYCSLWLNRGLGNATIADIDRYVRFTPLSLDPPMILLYAGENDISHGMTVADTVSAYKLLIGRLLTSFPHSRIHILGLKPSPAREKDWQKFSNLNQELREFTEEVRRVYFHSFPEANLEAEDTIFSKDGIHFTENGYKAFTFEINKLCNTQ